MPTQRQKNARDKANADAFIQGAVKRNQAAGAARKLGPVPLPEKGTKAQSELILLNGDRLRSALAPTTLAVALANNPNTLLEVPVVGRNGKITATWMRAGLIGAVIDLTGLKAWPR